MKYLAVWIAFLVLSIFPHFSYAKITKKFFNFSKSAQKCINKSNKSGLNSGPYVGPCTDFTQRNLQKAKLKNALQIPKKNLAGSSFEDRDVSRFYFDRTNLSFTNFQKADLRGVIFENVSLVGADFRGADLSGVEFRGNCILDGALYDDKTILTSLTDSQGRSGEKAATAANMLGIYPSSDVETETVWEGVIIKRIGWNEEKGKGAVVLSNPGRTQTFLKTAIILSDKIKTALTEVASTDVKIRFYLEDRVVTAFDLL